MLRLLTEAALDSKSAINLHLPQEPSRFTKRRPSRTVESRRHAGLFFCGEVLDAFGPVGGYNFYWARRGWARRPSNTKPQPLNQ